MPLFGHKNKNQTHGTSATDFSNDNAGTGAHAGRQQDFASTQQQPAGGLRDNVGTGGPGNAGNSQLNDPNAGAGYNSNSGAGGNQFDNQGQTAGAGQGVGGATQHQHGHHHQGQQAPVGSAALREQGMLRDREAQNYHAQSQELAEAERLEEKAREHRERAVAQGAHPHNKALGGGAQALGGQGQGATQSGAGGY